jgi:hypothetical protein
MAQGSAGPPTALRPRLLSAAGLTAGTAALAAGVGSLWGIHNPLAPHTPAGNPGAIAGAVLGAVVGLAAAALPRQDRRWALAVAGGAFGALAGLLFGLAVPGRPVAPGAMGALAGATLAAALLVLFRSRALLGTVGCLWVTGLLDPSRSPAPPLDPPALEAVTGYDVTARPVARIRPGTVVAGGPPEGWSHLVLHSRFGVSAGDVSRFPTPAAQAVAALSTVMLADVAPGPPYRLGTVARGVATTIRGRDVIVSPTTQEKLGAGLDLAARLTLERMEKHAQRTHVVARAPTMAVIDEPTFLLREGRHRPVLLRFALLVRPADGRLDALLWRIDGNARYGYEGAAGPLQWLPPSKEESCALHADAREFTLGVPHKESALALTALPGGRRLPMAGPLRDLAGRVPLTVDQAAELERLLRAALTEAADGNAF